MKENVTTPARKPSLYPYQERDLNILFDKLRENPERQNLLYQLPTGGGKTMIFSEITKRYIRQSGRKVIILTHRIELCKQTSLTLKNLGINNRIISSATKTVPSKGVSCYVAMVESLRHRIEDGLVDTSSVGLLIVDEAHHNSFHKLFDAFPEASRIGVTATPLSSDITLPLQETYQELIIGESIPSLVKDGFLAKPTTWRYDVELNTLQTGSGGDFTTSTSDELYSSPAMLDLLLKAYQDHAKNKKTLIFNNGIFTSRNVCEHFEKAGYQIKHLDNNTSPADREAILQWLKRTRGAILTSVSILTTGFDEPTVQAVILNRATTSLTLYHQMIGRGSRSLPKKKNFTIIDLGNNVERFGAWEAPLDWQQIFERPDEYLQRANAATAEEGHAMPSELRAKFPNTLELGFDIQGAFQTAISEDRKAQTVLRESMRQQAIMCIENAETVTDALALAGELKQEVNWRVKQYCKCLGPVTKNFREWQEEDYNSRLKTLVQKLMTRRITKKAAA